MGGWNGPPDLRALPEVIRFLAYDPGPEPDTADLAQMIRHHRRRRGLSIAALANKVRVDQATIQDWERRRHVPRLRLLRRLVWFLGFPMPPPGPQATLGRRLRATRISLGPTQGELSRRVGVGQ